MIKRYEDITLKDFNRIERTGKIGHLKFWYNIFPLVFFAKAIRKEIMILIEKLNAIDSDINNDIEYLNYKYKSIIMINAIRVNYLGIINILKIQTQLNGFKTYLSRVTNKKLKITRSENVNQYIKNIKEYTGIIIKDVDDVMKVKEYLEVKIDKYNQMVIQNRHDNSEEKKIFLSTLARKICESLHIPFDWNYTVLQIIDFKNEAIEESKKQKPEEDVRNQ
jgi:hypothetical protein